MIYKVLYQKDKIQNPRRETTQTLYLEAPSAVEARALVEKTRLIILNSSRNYPETSWNTRKSQPTLS
ncbi:hypothetical protein Lpp71_03976 [Lacticaseibacillus paracasei subsp. paracasei Lpp71]|uniref:Uncharacterized protein n=1 Tax=Lacticaseibacillus paracasei subsp. paracasei Lpp71 TaxID=1256207 RepID=A0A8E0ITR0_LACPA|nr:hypothetical protein Lpp71_03976 [Lacticaseibacillus paracasei subsp. paracasei Lpp71]